MQCSSRQAVLIWLLALKKTSSAMLACAYGQCRVVVPSDVTQELQLAPFYIGGQLGRQCHMRSASFSV
jgi:hypothetical protein